MPKFKCLIIDDDPLITDLVMHFSDKCELIEFCVSCNDAVEGLKLLSNSRFDILFLDYNMPALNGQDLLEIKRDESKVIMITSNKDFAVDSYKYDSVYDYLLKPLEYESFNMAVVRMHKRITEIQKNSKLISSDSIMVKDGSNWIPISHDSILYIKSDSNYCTFHTAEKKVMSLAKLKSLEEKLPSNFIRCHRSYIINTNFINYINLDDVAIQKEIIPISAMYKDAIKQYIESKT